MINASEHPEWEFRFKCVPCGVILIGSAWQPAQTSLPVENGLEADPATAIAAGIPWDADAAA